MLLKVNFRIGHDNITYEEAMKISEGSKFNLDLLDEDEVEIVIGNTIVAIGEVVSFEGTRLVLVKKVFK